MSRRCLAPTVLAAATLCLPMAAQESETAPPPPCSTDEYRQFDFWIGDWDVADAEGTPQGTNSIESILGGCVLRESWQGTSGSVGHSFNLYDRVKGVWHQTWVDNSGLLLEIEGGIENGAMVLNGDGKARDGSPVKHRITWTPLDDGRVRQHWQMSRDAGATWSDLFVGFYQRRES